MNSKLTKEEFLEKLKTDRDFNNRYGRKHITEGKMVLPPCHYGFQVYTRELSDEERIDWMRSNKSKVILPMRDPNVEFSMDEFFRPYGVPTRAISLMWNQRSVDTFLGLPFNIASYGLLLEIIAEIVNMVPDQLIGNLGDVHLYSNHIEQAREQIDREPFNLPNVIVNGEFWNPATEDGCGMGAGTYTDNIGALIEGFEISDFQIENYESHPTIKAPLSN